MTITLTIEDTATLTDHGSVYAITGTDEDGNRVTFGADPRMLESPLHELIIGDEPEVDVEIEEWQILSTEEREA